MPVLQGETTSSAETIHEPLPDLMAEYSDVQITLYGVTGTPEELLRMCPIPHDEMTIEAKNMFLVMGMNESKSEISEKHLSYFQKITESRGVELKVTAQEKPESQVDPVKVEPMEVRIIGGVNTAIQTTVEPVKAPNSGTEHKPQSKIQKTAKDITVATRQTYKITEKPDVNKEPLSHDVDETTTDQMDAWLTQLQHEYEMRFPTLKINNEPHGSSVITKADVSEPAYENEQKYEPTLPVTSQDSKPEMESTLQEPLEATIELSEEILEPETPTFLFEEFMANLPEPETAPTLETVQESANNMPVEDTLASLVSVIELSPPQQTEELRQIIAEAYEAVCLDIETIESGNIILSPEATKKVITLLSYIGYENAEEALEQLLESKNEEFLLHALGYLNQIVNKDTGPEFWQRFTNKKMYTLPSQTRFGKMLLQILGVQKLALN